MRLQPTDIHQQRARFYRQGNSNMSSVPVTVFRQTSMSQDISRQQPEA
jgi:hypothetical protein